MSAGQNMFQCMLLVRALLQTCRQLAEQVKHDQELPEQAGLQSWCNIVEMSRCCFRQRAPMVPVCNSNILICNSWVVFGQEVNAAQLRTATGGRYK